MSVVCVSSCAIQWLSLTINASPKKRNLSHKLESKTKFNKCQSKLGQKCLHQYLPLVAMVIKYEYELRFRRETQYGM